MTGLADVAIDLVLWVPSNAAFLVLPSSLAAVDETDFNFELVVVCAYRGFDAAGLPGS